MRTLLTVLTLGLLAGCNTMQGMGQDIQKGGQVISNTARDVANKF
ncbi:entericidin A/B family lipoprotein [Craterilacuibacter sinensis]|uniref:Entericidin A/B family lipoprotein n=1 Tax=Craterilacuibacter sinensis TaxID=2686017 RepID=A0A845BM10_9NEIS|nr:entericidin A/B family lipoprotein [Craterilacuibacter sinensis]MXR36314.1 entericidin A/B family lipoprotein [Craterilacuibacter sinensis]RQW27907.1 entericidin A/B family lipoprotein [Rhodobacteraceae bacterium CH30]